MENKTVKLLSEALASISLAYSSYTEHSKEIYDLIGDIQLLLNKFILGKQPMYYD